MPLAKNTPPGQSPCPCGSGRTYARCCGPWHDGEPAPTPEALMRSRYSAYALGLDDYVAATWHASTRPTDTASDDAVKWIGLKIVHAPQAEGDAAAVEFIARYKIGGRAYRMHETSRFVREDGRWYYVDGDVTDD
ncbi:YchJ family protein [Uliginosibacterium sp. sgz301328]|uniref:YchJ family protein n=1 Tax=Uliginosibacterium sp. sgz301328 TaxID=3243764 RepID=UPI00359E2793